MPRTSGTLLPGLWRTFNVAAPSVPSLTGLDQIPVTFIAAYGQEFQAMGIPKDDRNITVVIPPEAPVGQLGVTL